MARLSWGRLHRRLGPRYLDALIAGSLLAIMLLTVVNVMMAIPYLGATAGQYVKAVLAGEAAMLLAAAVWIPMVYRRVRPLTAWLRGAREPDSPAAAWSTAVDELPRVIGAVGAVLIAASLFPEIYVVALLRLPWYGVPLLFLGIGLLIAGGTIIVYLVWEQALRPIVMAVAPELPHDFPHAGRSLTLGFKLLALPPVVNIFTGILASALATRSLDPTQRVAVGIGATVFVSLTLGLAITLLLRRSLTSPVNALVQATQRVRDGHLDSVVHPVSGDELGRLTRSFNEMLIGLRERAAFHGALGSYVGSHLADRVARDGEIVEGETVEVTVLFADIRDFTSFVDRSEPEQTVAYLNQFFGLVLPIITAHGGHVNKLLGDGVLAVFGAPIPQADHADRGLRASCELIDAVWRTYRGELRIGIGLNSGKVIAGTIGGPGKLDYTLIGDAVNVAARVEQLTKETGDALLLTDATRQLLSDDSLTEARGARLVRGKTRETVIYSVTTPAPREDPNAHLSSPQ